MTTAEIIALQKRIGTPGDGFWGPRSIATCQRHLKRLMPNPNPWPKADLASMVRFYGQPGDVSNLVNLPVAGLGLRYAGKPVRTIRCHTLIADPLHRVLETIAAGPAAWILAQYAGCFNHRQMRGSTAWSKHAWGAAVDFAPATNGLRTHWPTRADMPIEAMEAFATCASSSSPAGVNLPLTRSTSPSLTRSSDQPCRLCRRMGCESLCNPPLT